MSYPVASSSNVSHPIESDDETSKPTSKTDDSVKPSSRYQRRKQQQTCVKVTYPDRDTISVQRADDGKFHCVYCPTVAHEDPNNLQRHAPKCLNSGKAATAGDSSPEMTPVSSPPLSEIQDQLYSRTDDEFTIIRHDAINLPSLGIVINTYLAAPVCLICRTVIVLSSLSLHVKQHVKHVKIPIEIVATLKETFSLTDDVTYPKIPIPAVYGLPVLPCIHIFCVYCNKGYTSRSQLESHQRNNCPSTKASGPRAVSGYAQKIQNGKSKRFIQVTIDNLVLRSGTAVDYGHLFVRDLPPAHDYSKNPIQGPEDNMNLSSFYYKDGWLDHVAGFTPSDLQEARRNSETDEPAGDILRTLAQRFLQETQKDIANYNAFGLMRTLADVGVSQDNGRHSFGRIEPPSVTKYALVLHRLVFACYRHYGGSWTSSYRYPDIDPTQQHAIDQLRTVIEQRLSQERQNSEDQDAIPERLFKELDDLYHNLCLKLFIHSRSQYAASSSLPKFFSPVISFVVIHCIHETGCDVKSSIITQLIAALMYSIRACILRQVSIRIRTTNVSQHAAMEPYVPFLKDKEETPMSFLFNATALLARIRSNETKDAEYQFTSVSGKQVTHKGHIITTRMLKAMIDGLLTEYLAELQNQAFFKEDDMPGIFPHFKLENLVENLQNRAAGYCFLDDPRNGFEKYRDVYGKWLLNDPKRAEKFAYVHNGSLTWNPQACERLLASLQQCRALLQVGLILSGGPSSRGSESSRHILRELPGAPRNLRVLFKIVCLVDVQDKTSHKRLKDKYVPHIPTREWTTALINYLVVIRPFEEYLVSQLFPPDSDVVVRYRHQLWPGLRRTVTSIDMSETMAGVMERYLNKPYKILFWRGLVTIFSSQFQDKFLFEVHKEFYADTANMHSSDMSAKHYAGLQSNLDGSDTRTIVGCIRVGLSWHELLDIGQTEPITLDDDDVDDEPRDVETSTVSHDTASLASHSVNQISTTIASNIESSVKSSITELMRESFAEMATIYFPKPPITCNSATLRSLTDITVHPSRLHDLRHFLQDPSTDFTSPEQAILLEHILSSEQDILGILGTGVGKTTLILMLAKMYANGKSLLVVLPLSSLYLDLKRRAHKVGLTITQWHPKHDKFNPNSHIICCAIEYLSFDSFHQFFNVLHQKNQLYRVICDEVQKILTDSEFRPAFKFFCLLNTVNCRLVAFTASLPPHLMETFNRLTGKVWKVIRMPSNRKEFNYSVIRLGPGSETHVAKTIEYIAHTTQTYRPEDRGIVFCRSIDAANSLASALGISACHSKENPDNMESTIDEWRKGTNKFLVSTSLLGCGFDYPSIRDVIHLDLAHSVLDQYQEDSRGGRDGKECRVVTILPARLKEPQTTKDCDTGVKEVYVWATKPQCLRIIPSHFIDGVAVTCTILHGAIYCSYCKAESSRPVPLHPAAMPVPYSTFSNREQVVRSDWYMNETPQPSSAPAATLNDVQDHRTAPSINVPQTHQAPSVFRPPPSSRQRHGSPDANTISHTPMAFNPLSNVYQTPVSRNFPQHPTVTPTPYGSSESSRPFKKQRTEHRESPPRLDLTQFLAPNRSASSKSSVTFASSPQSYHEVATPRHTSSPFEDSTFYQHNGFGASYDHEPSYQPHGNRSSSPTLQSSLCRSVYTASTSYQPSDIDLPSYNPYTSTPSSNIRHRMEGLSAVDYKNKWHNDIVKPIREILNKLSGACIECYCNAHTDWEEHATDDCPRYYNMQGTSELFKTWRASVVAPNGICFGCLISTKHADHTSALGKSCKDNGVLLRLCYASKVYSDTLKLTQRRDVDIQSSRFSTWLMELHPGDFGPDKNKRAYNIWPFVIDLAKELQLIK